MEWKVTRTGPTGDYPYEDYTTYVLLRGEWTECPPDWLPQEFLLLLSCMSGKVGKGKSKSYYFEEESSPQ